MLEGCAENQKITSIMSTAGSTRTKMRYILGMDEIKPQPGAVRENEVLLRDNDRWLHFANPQRVIFTCSLRDVAPALREIEREIEFKGWQAAGFLSYEAAPAFDPALEMPPGARLPAAAGEKFPLLWFGLYEKPNEVLLPAPPSANEVLNWRPTVDRETYQSAIERIKGYIARGQTYQVNYTLRLQADFAGDAWSFFLSLARNQNQYAAYIDTGRYVICSASPELFFGLDGETITCRPMKGTTGRGRTTAEDHERSEWLRNSEKNRAENVMIVDMIRNDLGRTAHTGSVHVPELFHTERYPTLWQMTSTVRARTTSSLSEIFAALFPCASITGAPKVRTMQIIAELEDTPRRIYTGSIGYIAPQRKAKFNVAIRTALIDRQQEQVEYGIGGGIVWDSHGPDEYDEALLKARVLTESPPAFALLETMLWTPEEGFFLREKHLSRMLDSAQYFDYPITRRRLETYLHKIASGFELPQRVRVLLDESGTLSSEAAPYHAEMQSTGLSVCLARTPVDSGDRFLYHKTTHRRVYETARADCPGFADVLLYNEQGELTEFTLGNLVVELEEQRLTPPIRCGVLPGTFRAHLLETGQVREQIIPLESLKKCSRIFRVNSVRRWQEVQLKTERRGIS